MSIWTLPELDQQIAAYKQALLTLSSAQTVTMGDTTFTRADTTQIRATLDMLADERATLTGGAGGRVVTARPRR